MNPATRPEFRTPEQIRVDEMVAAGDWSEFESVTELMTEEAALAVLDARAATAATNGVVNAAGRPAGGVGDQPFLWNGRPFRVTRAVYDHGHAEVTVSPPDAEFEAELKKRIEADRYHTLGYFQGFGFVCFPEDHARYQG